MAEGIMNHVGGRRFKAYSAGSYPTGMVNPFALQTLAKFNVPGDNFRSKNWNEFAKPDAPKMDFVFTVCDSAAGEVCPIWPGQPMTAHWGVPDPAAFSGSDDEKAKAFFDTALILKRRIELLLALPLARLDALGIQREIKDIGSR